MTDYQVCGAAGAPASMSYFATDVVRSRWSLFALPKIQAFPAWWLGLLVLAIAIGCSSKPTPEEKATEEAKAFGALPGLKATPDQALQDELARVVEDGGTPSCSLQERYRLIRT